MIKTMIIWRQKQLLYYIVDLSNGKITDDDTLTDSKETAETKLANKLKKTLTSDIVFEQWRDFLLMEEKKQI